ncbi:hypothetical protein UNDKW_5972 (plasmid) [Undibacterium sp. KW1]|uniref:hypothetical protein n=1 Tax=Undibacterium sp. KW1 TaxID=2058624 RepID=UPI001331DC37|nr:hypothetical protein [Undibacterium sp. KW1]BBB64245.1 hypothetical protein UNDKW_5972 [Undibacterium sp. KW1]
MSKFSIGDSLGARSPGDIAEYLSLIGDTDAAVEFQNGQVSGQGLLGQVKAYKHIGAILGYLPVPKRGEVNMPIQGISKLTGDVKIVGKRVKISLDKFYVAEYPGLGTHQILCEFTGKNQVSNETEELRFALRFKAGDKTSASVSGVPIFMGLRSAITASHSRAARSTSKVMAMRLSLIRLVHPRFKTVLVC